MSKQANRKHVQIFPRPEYLNAFKLPEGMSASGCSCMTALNDAPDLAETIETLEQTHNERIDLSVADYSSEEARKAAMAELNQVFKASQQSLRVDSENFDRVMSQAAPIVAIDGQVVALAMAPTVAQIEQALQSGEVVAARASCC